MRQCCAFDRLLLAAGLAGVVACGESAIAGGSGPPPGNTLHEIFSSYLGGSGGDMVRDVAFDAQGNIYVTGATDSPDFPTTPGAYARSLATGGQHVKDAFVAKFSPSGTLLWSTYLGGPNFERAYAIEIDPQGNVIVAGRAGAGLPMTAGTFQPTFMGGQSSYGDQDGFVCKLKGDGSTVIFCSYFGTSDPATVRDVAVDQNGDIYLAAYYEFGTFPSSWFNGSYRPTPNGGIDGVIAKVKGDGSQVVWASYIGGSGDEGSAPSIRVDASGVYYLSETRSTDLPTPGGFDHSLGGSVDLFLAKLSLDGTQLIFSTFIGGSGPEAMETHGLALDSQGNVFAAALTGSADFPTTPNAYQRTFGGGPSDAFVTKLSSTGQLLASTFAGGNGSESAEGVMADPLGNLYFAGNSNSANFPPATSSSGLYDLVAIELSADLSQILFSGRVGGSAGEFGRAAAVDIHGNFVAAGTTASPNWPTMNAYQGTFQGGNEDGALLVFQR